MDHAVGYPPADGAPSGGLPCLPYPPPQLSQPVGKDPWMQGAPRQTVTPPSTLDLGNTGKLEAGAWM